MILAAIGDYVHLWQLPLILLYFGVWLIGGPYLTRLALRKQPALSRRQTSLAGAAKVNLLANGAALLALAITSGSLVLLAQRLGVTALYLIALPVAPLVMLAVAWAAHWAMLDLPSRAAWAVVLRTTGLLLLLGAVLGVGIGVPSRYQRLSQIQRDFCRDRLAALFDNLKKYADRHPGRQAADLQVLVRDGYVPPDILTCPGRPEDSLGYLYVPAPVGKTGPLSHQILVCDRRGNHGRTRMVLFSDDHVEELSEPDFQRLLQEPVNQAMAKLAEADR